MTVKKINRQISEIVTSSEEFSVGEVNLGLYASLRVISL